MYIFTSECDGLTKRTGFDRCCWSMVNDVLPFDLDPLHNVGALHQQSADIMYSYLTTHSLPIWLSPCIVLFVWQWWQHVSLIALRLLWQLSIVESYVTREPMIYSRSLMVASCFVNTLFWKRLAVLIFKSDLLAKCWWNCTVACPCSIQLQWDYPGVFFHSHMSSFCPSARLRIVTLYSI